MRSNHLLVILGLALGTTACSRSEPPAAASHADAPASAAALPAANPDNNVYFGDVHVHTGWSFDALTNGSKTTPTDAYAWAQGKPITGSGGPEMQIQTPLDFYMVSDHAEYMGVFNEMSNPDSPLSKTVQPSLEQLWKFRHEDAPTGWQEEIKKIPVPAK